VSNMVVLRCTRKLLRHMGSGSPAGGDLPKSTTRLGDWYPRLRRSVLAVFALSFLAQSPIGTLTALELK